MGINNTFFRSRKYITDANEAIETGLYTIASPTCENLPALYKDAAYGIILVFTGNNYGMQIYLRSFQLNHIVIRYFEYKSGGIKFADNWRGAELFDLA